MMNKKIADLLNNQINQEFYSAYLYLDIANFYCLDCLAEYLDCTVQELLDKIEEFKEEGCKLFEGK